MTPQEIRTDLIRILGSLLGTYTTASGTKTYAAIHITPPLVDPSWKVTGLQVSIFKAPEVQSIEPLTGEKLKRLWWVIELVQNDVNQSIRPALEIIEDYYPVCVSRVKPQTRTDYEQARISVYDPQFTGVSQILLT
jgi:hypothetical protein